MILREFQASARATDDRQFRYMIKESCVEKKVRVVKHAICVGPNLHPHFGKREARFRDTFSKCERRRRRPQLRHERILNRTVEQQFLEVLVLEEDGEAVAQLQLAFLLRMGDSWVSWE